MSGHTEYQAHSGLNNCEILEQPAIKLVIWLNIIVIRNWRRRTLVSRWPGIQQSLLQSFWSPMQRTSSAFKVIHIPTVKHSGGSIMLWGWEKIKHYSLHLCRCSMRTQHHDLWVTSYCSGFIHWTNTTISSPGWVSVVVGSLCSSALQLTSATYRVNWGATITALSFYSTFIPTWALWTTHGEKT